MLTVRTERPPDISLSEAEASPGGPLDSVVDSIKILEREIAEKQGLLEILTARLDDQVRNLNRLRQIAEALAKSPGPEFSVASNEAAVGQLRIHCLGPFQVHIGDVEIPLPHLGKGLTILKYLAMVRKPVPKDVLMELLWPETPPQVANNRLKVAMHHLRQAFAPTEITYDCRDCILFGGGCYLLNPDFDTWLDVDFFERNWQAGLQHERAGRLDQAIPLYIAAEMTYRGDLLEQDLLEEWTLARREALKDIYLRLLDKLSRHWLRTGNTERAIEGWNKILAKDPYREDAYRNLMVCYARTGRRTLALRCFEICTQTFHSQLELAPDPITFDLYRRIREGESIQAWLDF